MVQTLLLPVCDPEPKEQLLLLLFLLQHPQSLISATHPARPPHLLLSVERMDTTNTRVEDYGSRSSGSIILPLI